MTRQCFYCDLASNRKHIVYGTGTVPNQIMIIGEAPGNKEDSLGIPFVGKSGIFFRKHLARLHLEESYITNVVKCRPVANATPQQHHIDICTKYFLNKELNTVRPKFIITVGKVATNFFVKGAMTQLSGTVISKQIGYSNHLGNIVVYPTYILPIYHPSYILRNNLSNLFEDDMNKIYSNILRL
jgi:DNA polymerase